MNWYWLWLFRLFSFPVSLILLLLIAIVGMIRRVLIFFVQTCVHNFGLGLLDTLQLLEKIETHLKQRAKKDT